MHAGLERHADHPVVVELSARQRGLVRDRIAVGVDLRSRARPPVPGALNTWRSMLSASSGVAGSVNIVHALAVDADFEVLLADEVRDVVVDAAPERALMS